MSAKTRKRRKNQMIQQKKITIVQRTSRNG
jgi:hypothetical protein